MSDQLANPDLIVARLAARQHGVVSVHQLRVSGLDKHDVLHRARTGRLHRVHRGVYAVGHPGLSRHGAWMAAVLACETVAATGHRTAPARGRKARAEHGDAMRTPPATAPRCRAVALSHRSAAALWRLLPPTNGAVEVTVQGGSGRMRREGICLHRSRTLTPEVVRRHWGIPVTTPARTIADLRRTVSAKNQRFPVSAQELRRAIRQADVLGLSLGPEADTDRTRSELEHRFLRLCRRHRLPPPEVNVRIGSMLVDFLWRDRMLVVETDGYRYHRGHSAFEHDRDRDLRLRALGYEVIRLSHRQVVDESQSVVAALKKLLTPSGSPPRKE